MDRALSDRHRFTKKRMTGLLLLGLLTIAASAQWLPMDTGIPAFHGAPPRGTLPPLLPEDQRTGMYFTRHYQTVAYQMAAAVPSVIYQQPCFCWCSRAMGHKSLYSCFQDTHGATCTVCMSEAAFAYGQTRLGKTPAEIRAAIIRGEWKAVTLPGLSLE